MKNSKAVLVFVLVMTLGGCAPFFAGVHDLQENNLGYVYCIEGHGPPLTGSGHVVAVGLKKGFEGVIMVRENCQIAVDHYLPYKEKVEELKKQSGGGGLGAGSEFLVPRFELNFLNGLNGAARGAAVERSEQGERLNDSLRATIP